jgi:hypothetical protein
MNVPQLQQEIKPQLVPGSELPGGLQGGNVEDDQESEDAFAIKIITRKQITKVSRVF